MRPHPFIILSLAAAATAAAACDASTSPRFGAVTTTPADSTARPLVISPNRVQLAVGTTAQLSTNATTAQQPQLQWTSSQTAVATVSQSGLVTAIGVGTVAIRARFTTDTTNTATATIDVTAAGAIP